MSVARAEVFDDLRKRGWSKIEQSTSLRVYDPEHQFTGTIRVPVREFALDEIVLTCDKPVEITITEEEGQFFATSEALNIDAVGDTVQSLMSDFAQHVIYFYNYYNDLNESQVMGNAARLKEIYRSHFHY